MRSRQTMTIAALAAAVAFMLAAAPAVANTDILADIEKAITDLQKTDKKLKKDVRQLAKQVEALQQENEKQQKQIKRLKDFRGDAREDIHDMRDYDRAVAYLSTLSHLPATDLHSIAEWLVPQYRDSEHYDPEFDNFGYWYVARSMYYAFEGWGYFPADAATVFIAAQGDPYGEIDSECVVYVHSNLNNVSRPAFSCEPPSDQIKIHIMEGTTASVVMTHDTAQLQSLTSYWGDDMELDYVSDYDDGSRQTSWTVSAGMFDWQYGQYNGTLVVNTYPAWGSWLWK